MTILIVFLCEGNIRHKTARKINFVYMYLFVYVYLRVYLCCAPVATVLPPYILRTRIYHFTSFIPMNDRVHTLIFCLVFITLPHKSIKYAPICIYFTSYIHTKYFPIHNFTSCNHGRWSHVHFTSHN